MVKEQKNSGTGRAAVPTVSPTKVIRTYSADEWQVFVEEWCEGFEPPYTQVINLGGSGDKGRDVVAYVTEPNRDGAIWDSYQCKHYAAPLTPTNVYTELGKLLVYTHRGDYTVPRRYRFVAPREVGIGLHDLLKNHDKLREQLLANWDKHCKSKISSVEQFPAEGSLREYIGAFDFGIVWYLTTSELLSQHEKTKYWHRRFKLEAPVRPEAPTPPLTVQPHEMRYVRCLMDAYSSTAKAEIANERDLEAHPSLHGHFQRSRAYFFSAEALARFSRDNFSPLAFENVKRHIHDAVGDVPLQEHRDGFACVLSVTTLAANVALPASDVTPYVGPADKKGACHHLSNEGKLSWAK